MEGMESERDVSKRRRKVELSLPALGLFSPKDGERREGFERTGLVGLLLVESVDGVPGVLEVESGHPGFRFVCIVVTKPFNKVHEWTGFPPEIHLRVEDRFHLVLQISVDLHRRRRGLNSIRNIRLVMGF